MTKRMQITCDGTPAEQLSRDWTKTRAHDRVNWLNATYPTHTWMVILGAPVSYK